MTAEDAERYLEAYETRARRDRRGLRRARHLRGARPFGKALGAASALQPRPAGARDERTLSAAEELCRLRARRCDIGLNIDAEESERLDISLDLLEALCRDPELAGLERRRLRRPGLSEARLCVVDWLIDLARATKRRIMVRLVKGAYWDSEIKRAQVEGLEGFPGLHAQDPHRRLLSRLREAAAGGARRRLPAIRDPQRADAGRRSSHGGRELLCRANTSSSACTAWASRSTSRSSARRVMSGRAASMRRSARTRRCSPIWCAACSRTAPTPRSSTGSPTRTCRSTR